MQKTMLLINIFLSINIYIFSYGINVQDVIFQLLSKNHKEYIKAEKILQQLPPQNASKIVIEALKRADSIQTKRRLIAILKQINYYDSAIDVLKLIKQEEEPEIIEDYINLLGFLKNRKAVKLLCEYTISPYWKIRRAAILALKDIGDERMYPCLIDLFISSKDIYRVYAADALYYLYNQRMLPLLKEKIKDKNKSIRILVLRILERVKNKDFYYDIANLITNDKNSEVRIKAIKVAMLWNDRWFSPYIIKALKDKDKEVRLYAILALTRLKEGNAIYAINELSLREKSLENKFAILGYYAKIKNPKALPGLIHFITTDPDEKIRYLATALIGYINIPTGANILIQALKDKSKFVRAEAIYSLSRIKYLPSIPQIIYMLKKDKTPYVRTAALYTLKNFILPKYVVDVYNAIFVQKDPFIRNRNREVVEFLIKRFIK